MSSSTHPLLISSLIKSQVSSVSSLYHDCEFLLGLEDVVVGLVIGLNVLLAPVGYARLEGHWGGVSIENILDRVGPTILHPKSRSKLHEEFSQNCHRVRCQSPARYLMGRWYQSAIMCMHGKWGHSCPKKGPRNICP